MKGALIHDRKSGNPKPGGIDFLLKFLVIPMRAGLYGFALFFTILVFAKVFWYVLGYLDLFSVTADDVLLSLIGFAIIFLVRLIQNLKIYQT